MSVNEVAGQLLVLVDRGVSVKEAAGVVGVGLQRAYLLLREVRGPMRKHSRITDELRVEVIKAFDGSGSPYRAGLDCEISESAARRVLVQARLVQAQRGGSGAGRRGKPEAKKRFLELIEQGWSTARASAEVGINERTGRDWRQGIKQARGKRIYPDGTVVDYRSATTYQLPMTPSVDAPTNPRYFSADDRLVIADGLVNQLSLRQIATILGKNVSSVCREVRKHSIEGYYLPYQAHRDAAMARARPKPCKLVTNHQLRVVVEAGLEKEFSPEQISNRLKVDYPMDENMRVSHETIYQALYFQARGGLKKEVQKALRSGRTRRKPQKRVGQRTKRFIDPMIMISERPCEVEDRAVPGHWEGDRIMGEGNRSAIGTLVERSTRYTMLLHLPGDHEAETVRDALIATVQTLPEHLRGSLTWDQGAEMARHKQFTMATDMDVYFCDPASPWQRGSNENTNGPLRQYFPKGSDLSAYGPEDLEHVAQKLNGRPRKTLDWETPAERLHKLLIS